MIRIRAILVALLASWALVGCGDDVKKGGPAPSSPDKDAKLGTPDAPPVPPPPPKK